MTEIPVSYEVAREQLERSRPGPECDEATQVCAEAFIRDCQASGLSMSEIESIIEQARIEMEREALGLD